MIYLKKNVNEIDVIEEISENTCLFIWYYREFLCITAILATNCSSIKGYSPIWYNWCRQFQTFICEKSFLWEKLWQNVQNMSYTLYVCLNKSNFTWFSSTTKFYFWLYVIMMSHRNFRVNLHSIVCLDVKELLDWTSAISEV